MTISPEQVKGEEELYIQETPEVQVDQRGAYDPGEHEVAIIANMIRDKKLAEKVIEKASGYLSTRASSDLQAAATALLPPIKRK